MKLFLISFWDGETRVHINVFAESEEQAIDFCEDFRAGSTLPMDTEIDEHEISPGVVSILEFPVE